MVQQDSILAGSRGVRNDVGKLGAFFVRNLVISSVIL